MQGFKFKAIVGAKICVLMGHLTTNDRGGVVRQPDAQYFASVNLERESNIYKGRRSGILKRMICGHFKH